METVRWLIVIIIYFVISEVIMLKIEKKIVDIQAFVLPKINHDSEHLLLAVILTDNNINILKYYFDHSKYRWLTGEKVTEVDEYAIGNILFLYENGQIAYENLETVDDDEQIIEYVFTI